MYAFTITSEHVHARHTWPDAPKASRIEREAAQARTALGRIMAIDVGKRVYRVGDIYQVENDEQRAQRLAR